MQDTEKVKKTVKYILIFLSLVGLENLLSSLPSAPQFEEKG
jgi:hypothetical protein